MKVLTVARALAAALLIAISSSSATASIQWDSTTDFTSPSTNPNGVWSYGYASTTYNGPVTLFTSSQFYVATNDPSTGGADYFGYAVNPNDKTPGYYKTTSGNAYGVATGEAALHGGANGEYAVLRFTAPSSGLFDVTASWKPGNTGDADLYLLLNSAAAYLAYTPSTDVAGSFVFTLNLLAGDTIDLVLGTAGEYFSDSTPVNLLVESAVPEPASVAVWGAIACLGGMFGYRRFA